MKRLGAIAALVVLVVVAVVWVLASRSGGGSAGPKGGPEPASTPAATPPAPDVTFVAAIPATSDPDVYARAIADVVFGMDTRRLTPGDYRGTLMGEADPSLSATGRADLARMLTERVPTTEQWARMRANLQWSTWVNLDVHLPGSWEQVLISGRAEPGWAFRNVSGVQTTHYVEDGATRTASRERTITTGMRCPADGAEVDREGTATRERDLLAPARGRSERAHPPGRATARRTGI